MFSSDCYARNKTKEISFFLFAVNLATEEEKIEIYLWKISNTWKMLEWILFENENISLILFT